MYSPLALDTSIKISRLRRDRLKIKLPSFDRIAWIGESLFSLALQSLIRVYSLDRTNVVQSALGKWVLNNQLRQIGVLGNKESVDEHPVFLHLFRNRQ